jgi:hypothetical protein
MVLTPASWFFYTVRYNEIYGPHQGQSTFYYQTGPQSFVAEALTMPSARRVVEALFSGFVRMQRNKGKLRGCMIVSSALACGEQSQPVRRGLAALREAAVKAIGERFERTVRENDLPEGSECATLARYVVTVLNGLAIQAMSGATENELRKVAAMAIRAWPDRVHRSTEG